MTLRPEAHAVRQILPARHGRFWQILFATSSNAVGILVHPVTRRATSARPCAAVKLNGQPANRTVVYRGFLGDSAAGPPRPAPDCLLTLYQCTPADRSVV